MTYLINVTIALYFSNISNYLPLSWSLSSYSHKKLRKWKQICSRYFVELSKARLPSKKFRRKGLALTKTRDHSHFIPVYCCRSRGLLSGLVSTSNCKYSYQHSEWADPARSYFVSADTQQRYWLIVIV